MRARVVSFLLHALAVVIGFLVPFAPAHLDHKTKSSEPLILRLAPPPTPRVLDKPHGGGTMDNRPATRGRPPLVARNTFTLPPRPPDRVPQLIVVPTIE